MWTMLMWTQLLLSDAGASHPAGYYSETVAGQRSDQPSLLPSAAGQQALSPGKNSGRQGAMQ